MPNTQEALELVDVLVQSGDMARTGPSTSSARASQSAAKGLSREELLNESLKASRRPPGTSSEELLREALEASPIPPTKAALNKAWAEQPEGTAPQGRGAQAARAKAQAKAQAKEVAKTLAKAKAKDLAKGKAAPKSKGAPAVLKKPAAVHLQSYSVTWMGKELHTMLYKKTNAVAVRVRGGEQLLQIRACDDASINQGLCKQVMDWMALEERTAEEGKNKANSLKLEYQAELLG